MPIDLTIEQQGIQRLARELRSFENGTKLRRHLARDMRGALDPLVNEIRSGVMAVANGPVPTEGEPLRSAVAKNIRAQARFAGKATGARVHAKKPKGTRGFANAPKRLNQTKGWRHPVFGGDTWVRQVGKPRYWDEPIESGHRDMRKAVLRVLEQAARDIARKGA